MHKFKLCILLVCTHLHYVYFWYAQIDTMYIMGMHKFTLCILLVCTNLFSVYYGCIFVPQREIIYLTLTRNEVTISEIFKKHLKNVFEILKLSPIFSMTEFKISYRQMPSIGSELIFKVCAHKNPLPTICNRKNCKICEILYRGDTWISNDNYKIKASRITCQTKHTVYILVENSTNECLYIGTTCQNLNVRISTHRSKSKKFKKT